MWRGNIASIAELNPADNTLLVFMDDTGKEGLDRVYQPVFGFGGVITTMAEYDSALRSPWTKMRAAIGLQDGDQFHATSLPHGDIPTVQEVFRANRFGRFAGIMTADTNWPNLKASAVEWMARVMQLRVMDIARWSGFTSVALILEDSQEMKGDIQRLFGAWRIEENGHPIPIQIATMTKHPCEAGLEAADYVANRAAKEVKLRMRGEPWPHAESPAIFHTLDRRLVSFLMVDRIEAKEAEAA